MPINLEQFAQEFSPECIQVSKVYDWTTNVISLTQELTFVKADYFFPKIAGLKFPRRTSLILLFFLLEPFFPQSIAFPL